MLKNLPDSAKDTLLGALTLSRLIPTGCANYRPYLLRHGDGIIQMQA